jgi:hypothetical protein
MNNSFGPKRKILNDNPAAIPLSRSEQDGPMATPPAPGRIGPELLLAISRGDIV